MNRKLRTFTSLATLLAFGAMAMAPRLAVADDAPGKTVVEKVVRTTDEAPKLELRLAQATPPPDPGYQTQPPPNAQPMPPGYYYPAPGYQPGYPAQPPPPPGYYMPQPPRRVIVGYEERPRWGLFAGGLSMFLAAYMPTMLVGVSLANECDCGKLAVPVIGPLLMWQSGDTAPLNSLLVFDTMIQAGGVAMLVAGLAAKKKVPVYQNFAVAPILSPSFAGASAVGYF